MPRNYDTYLLGSLCQSESDGEPVTAVTDCTPARRPSLGEALPKIPLRLQGCGVSVSLKAGPHVRLHKLLDKWKSCFPDPISAPMAWPVVLAIGEEEVRVTSIQDSISRAIGPDRLSKLADDDGLIVVTIGMSNKPHDETDVAPPQPEGESEQSCLSPDKIQTFDNPQKAEVSVTPGTIVEPPIAVAKKPITLTPFNPAPNNPVSITKKDTPKTVFKSESNKGPPEHSLTIKVVVESDLSSQKKCKLNVSSNCVVSRLIRKWAEAAKVTVDPSTVVFCIDGHVALSREVSLHEALALHGRAVDSETRLTLQAVQPRSKRKDMTPLAARDQEAELEFWSQTKALKLEVQRKGGWQEDDEALQFALSL